MPASVRAFFSLRPVRKCASVELLLNVRLFFRLCFSHSCHGSRLAPNPELVVVHADGYHPEKTRSGSGRGLRLNPEICACSAGAPGKGFLFTAFLRL